MDGGQVMPSTFFPMAADVVETQACTFFRNALFRALRREEAHVRATALDTIARIVDEWTVDYHRKVKTASLEHKDSSATVMPRRPSLSQTSTGSSGVSSGVGSSRQSSSQKVHKKSLSKGGLNFDDVFELDDSVATAASTDGKTSLPKVDVPPTFAIAFANINLTQLESVAWRELSHIRSTIDLPEEVLTADEMKANLENYYMLLLRLTLDCPFKDVRHGCRAILRKAKANGAETPEVPSSGPSYFIPRLETIGLKLATSPSSPVSNKSSQSQLPEPSDDEDEPPMSPAHEFTGTGFPVGIIIPGASSSDRGRSRSRGRSITGSFGSRGGGGGRRGFQYVHDRATPLTSPSGDHAKFNIRRRFHNAQSRNASLPCLKAKIPSQEVHKHQTSLFMRDGRVTNVNKLLCFFPEFANSNANLTYFLLNGTGSALPRSWKFYLAIMAVAEHKCQYYISLLSSYFLENGGAQVWLRGLEYAPKKLRRIARLNSLLAHQPWKITHLDVRELVKGISNRSKPVSLDPIDNWSTSEVVLAMSILSYYHAQAAFAMGCGLVPEADTPGGTVESLKLGTLAAGRFVMSQVSETLEAANEMSAPTSGIKLSSSSSGISLLSKKRYQFTNGGHHAPEQAPDKWLKTPGGGVPSSAPTTAAPSRASSPQFKRISLQKRRKSFEDCVASDDAPLPTLIGTSISAPTSYIPVSSLSNIHPRELFFSPSSSASISSYNETPNNVTSHSKILENIPVNVLVEDYTRFIQPPSKSGITGVNEAGVHDEFDLNSEEYSFLPMEDFDWERNACEVVGEYVEGLEDVLDEYFRNCQNIGSDGEREDADSTPPSFMGSSFTSDPFDMDKESSSDQFFATSSSGSYVNESSQYNASYLHSQSSFNFSSAESSFTANTTKSVSTSTSLKEAIWFYSLRLLGIQKDDYTYSYIKILLPKTARGYLKRVCAMPELVTMGDWKSAGTGLGLKGDEMVEVCLLASQARFMGGLLYGVKAVCGYRENLRG